MNNVTDLTAFRKKKVVDKKAAAVDVFMEDLRRVVNDAFEDIDHVTMVGGLSSFLGRVIGTELMEGGKLNERLLWTAIETTILFAEREAGKVKE